MAIDTQGLASIGELGGFDPGAAQQKALSIKDMMDREQMNKLQLSQQKQEAKTQAEVQNLLKGENIDYSSNEGVMRTAEKLNKISPKASLEFQTQAQKFTSGKVAAQVDQYELLDHQQGVIVSAIDPIVAEARAMKNRGASDMEVNALIAQRLPGTIQQLQNTKLPNGESALSPAVTQQINAATQAGPMTLSTLEGFEAKSKAGQAQIRQRLEQLKADTATKKEDEGERHNRVVEQQNLERVRQGQEKIDNAKQKLMSQGFSDRQSGILAALADANVSLPAGLRSQAQQKATLDGLIKAHPEMSDAEIAENIKSGKLKLAAETAASRTAGNQVGKVTLATNEITPFGQQVLEASKNLPRGTSVTMNGLMQMGEKEVNNPQLLVLRAKLQALNSAYDQLAARGGTDKDKRAHIHELFDARLNDANIQALVKAINEEGAGAKEAADKTIGEVSGSASVPGVGPRRPGQAPAGPPAPFSDAEKEARYQKWKAEHPTDG